MVFVCIWFFQTQCLYQYYTPNIQIWVPMFNDTRTVPKKLPYEYGVLYGYGDVCTGMVIFRVWILIYIG